MARLLPSTRRRREEATDDGTTLGELDLRSAVLGVGALTAGYLVGRRLATVGGMPTAGLRGQAGEALPGNGVDVPIGGTDEEGDESAGDEAAEVAGTDPSLEEVDERSGQPRGDDSTVGGTTRVEEDVGDEPAEPGEMQVDEEVVEEAAASDEEPSAADDDEE